MAFPLQALELHKDNGHLTPEEGRWILWLALFAWLAYMIKCIALYYLLHRTGKTGRNGPLGLLVFLLMLTVLVLLPYHDPKASKWVNRLLITTTIVLYVACAGLAYVILLRG